jgi:tricorn protease
MFESVPPVTRALVAGGLLAVVAAAQGAELSMTRYPAVSPDGRRVAFSYEGDLWIGPSEGGLATRVTAQPSREGRSAWSPDGGSLAFESDRFGNVDVFVQTLSGGEPRRLTWHSDSDRLVGFTADGAHIAFVSRRQTTEGRGYGKLYLVPVEGGAERPVSEIGLSDASLAADGRRLAFTRGAESWWRKDYRGSANLDVWTLDLSEGIPRRVTTWEGNDFAPLWNPRGDGFYFVRESDRAHNVWFQPNAGAPTQVTSLPRPGVRSPSLNATGTRLSFEADTASYVVDVDPAAPGRALGPPRRVVFTGFSDPAASEFEETVSGGVTEFAVSPDEKTLFFVAGGEIWATEKKAKGPRRTRRLTDSAAGERSIASTPDGEGVLFVSDASGEEQIWRVVSDDPEEKRLVRARRFKVEKLTETPGEKSSLKLSPDKETLAYVRGLGDLVLADPKTLEDRRVVSTGFHAPNFDWSADSKRLALSKDDDDFNTDVWIVDAEGVEASYNVSRHPDEDVAPSWDPKGRFLVFASRDGLYQDYELTTVWLRKADYEKTALDWEDEEEAKKEKGKGKDLPTSRPESGPASRPESGPATRPESGPAEGAASRPEAESKPSKEDKKPKEKTKIEFDDLHKRVKRPTSGLGSRVAPTVSPDGKSIAFLQTGPDSGLYLIDVEGKKKDKLQPLPASDLLWVGDDLFFTAAGQLCSTSKSGSKTVYDFSGVRKRRLKEERRLVFVEAWRKMRDHFYDPNLHGADWNAARALLEPWAMAASTSHDLEVVVTLLLGELNGSHLGFRSAGGWSAPYPSRTAETGAIYDESFEGPGLRVKSVVPGTPADAEKSKLLPGDVILAVDDVAVADAPNPWAALDRKAGREATLRVRRGDATLDVVLTPTASIDRDVYEAEVAARQKKVHEATDGRVGYVHIAGMDQPELLRFERELFGEGFDKKCLVIDVRGNGGGWTADLLFTMLTQPKHATTTPRGGGEGYPQDRRVFAAWTKPIVVLCDEFSYSNAEIFSHGIKTLKRGPVVGKTTYGAVISTGGFRLLDGSSLRNPFRGWRCEGTGLNMENNGCVPDVQVENLPHDVAAGKDAQLDAAIAEALKQI